MKKLYTTLLSAAAVLSASATAPLQSVGTLTATTQTIDAPMAAKTMHRSASVITLAGSDMKKSPVKKSFENETWESLGTGTFYEPVISSLYNGVTVEPLAVDIEKSTTTEGLYRIVEPYKNFTPFTGLTYDASKATPLIFAVDGKYFYMEDWSTGLDAGDGEFAVTTQVAGLYPQYSISLIAQVYPDGIGSYNNGVLTYPVTMTSNGKSYYNMLISEGDPDAGYYRGNTNGQFKILMPGAVETDYSISVEHETCLDDNKFTFQFKLGADVKKYKIFINKGEAAASDANYQYVAQKGQEFASTDTKITADLSTNDRGVYTVFAVTLDDDGAYVEGLRAIVYVLQDEADKWETIADKATYTDGVISSLYSDVDATTHEVVIEKSKDQVGYYRLVNPYDAPYAYASSNVHQVAHKHYIYINATDPERVYVEESPVGFELGDGEICVTSMAWRYLQAGTAADDVDAANWGTLKDGVITMPDSKLAVRETKYENGKWYLGNAGGTFKVQLPASEAVTNIAADTDASAPVEYFNMQGQRVANPSAGQLVIKRQGTSITKVFVK